MLQIPEEKISQIIQEFLYLNHTARNILSQHENPGMKLKPGYSLISPLNIEIVRFCFLSVLVPVGTDDVVEFFFSYCMIKLVLCVQNST